MKGIFLIVFALAFDFAFGQSSEPVERNQEQSEDEQDGEVNLTVENRDFAVAAIIKLAISLGAPIAKEGMKKLQSDIFGSGRAARSTDVLVVNESDNDLFYVSATTETGILTSSMLPAKVIKAHTSSVYGCESHGFMTGATDCKVTYKTAKGKKIWFSTSNPYAGKNTSSASKGIEIETGGGNNNIVHFFIGNEGLV